MASKKPVKIKYVEWRDGRPRFKPGPGLRNLGYTPRDLKHRDGAWFTEGEAMDWSNKFGNTKLVQDDIDAGGTGVIPLAPPPKPQGTYPVSKLAEEWLKNPRLQLKADRTQQDYRQKIMLLGDHDPDLWASEVTSLDYQICYGLYETLLEERGVSTARGTMGALGRAIKWAMQRGKVKIPVNPCRDLDMETPDPRARFITPEEFKWLIWAAEKKKKRVDVADMIYCGVWTGQRQGDRLQLETSAVRNGRFIVYQGKTRAIVNPPVSPQYMARIEEGYRRRKVQKVVSTKLHINESTWEPWNHWTYRQLFAEVRLEAAKKCKSCATIMEKDLRATAVTWLALAGATIAEICAITGHSLKTATDILRHYLAIHPDMATTAIGKMVEWFDAGASIDMAV
ncbi:tyrosine-type recombinase/integrase [Rhizobium sp. NPDC090275]|uniref:tyrosine-type recombinase/integrase n=1 Tax=Rhizobium sp. NPDC090275 TaxID=3364498 RepID=UPI00383AFAA8